MINVFWFSQLPLCISMSPIPSLREVTYLLEDHSDRKLWIRCSKLCAPTPRLPLASTSDATGGVVCIRGQQVRRRSKKEGLSFWSRGWWIPSPVSYKDFTPYSPLQERRSQGLGREEKDTEQGTLWAPSGKVRVAPAGVQELLQLLSDPAVGLQDVWGQVGHWVVLGDAGGDGNSQNSFWPMRPPFLMNFPFSLMRTHGLA